MEGDRSLNPYGWQYTHNIYGGKCNQPGLPCYDLARAVLQFHAFVTGSRTTGPGDIWDCTGNGWRRHWTQRAELYCWVDFLKILDRIPAGATVTDPATVATAWGRTMPKPVISSVSPASGPLGGGQSVTISGRNFWAVGSPSDAFLAGRGLRVTFGGRLADIVSAGPTALSVRVPAGVAPDAVSVVVTDADGQSAVKASAYSYTS